MSKVLIVEDELVMANMAEEILVVHGYEVCGIARTIAEGIALGQFHRPDLAVIDLRLACDGLGTEVAARLGILKNLGILYVAGNGSHTLTDGHACLSKPYRSEHLLRALEIVEEIVRTGKASLPFPAGFRLLPFGAAKFREGANA